MMQMLGWLSLTFAPNAVNTRNADPLDVSFSLLPHINFSMATYECSPVSKRWASIGSSIDRG